MLGLLILPLLSKHLNHDMKFDTYNEDGVNCTNTNLNEDMRVTVVVATL